MSEPAETAPANPSNPAALLLEDVFFAPLFQALQTPGITRNCATVDDASFVALAVLRVLEKSKTGRDFIQTLSFTNTPGHWRRITASCPDSEEIYITLTNQMTLSPGALNQCRRLRWAIEQLRPLMLAQL